MEFTPLGSDTSRPVYWHQITLNPELFHRCLFTSERKFFMVVATRWLLTSVKFNHLESPLSAKFATNYSVSVNFISLVTSCVELRDEEPQTANPMHFTRASHIAASALAG